MSRIYHALHKKQKLNAGKPVGKHIVTRESLIELVTRGDETSIRAIGKALVHLFNRQTDFEKEISNTVVHNMRGFTSADARQGTITAKYYLKHGTLQPWQIQRWIKPNKNGVPRIAKYWEQLDEEAKRRAGI